MTGTTASKPPFQVPTLPSADGGMDTWQQVGSMGHLGAQAAETPSHLIALKAWGSPVPTGPH